MLFSRLKKQQPKHHALAFVFSIAFLWITTGHASESAEKIRAPKDALELIIDSSPDDFTKTKEIKYFGHVPKPGDKPKTISGNELIKLGKEINKRIYGKPSDGDEKLDDDDKYGHYFFQSTAIIGLKKNEPVWYLHSSSNYLDEGKPLDPSSTEHFALAFIDDDIGYGVYTLKKLEAGTLIGPFTGLISKKWPHNIRKSSYGLKKAFNDEGVNASLTGSFMTFVNHAPQFIDENSEAYQAKKKPVEETNAQRLKNKETPLPLPETEYGRVTKNSQEIKESNKHKKNERAKVPLLPPIPKNASTANILVVKMDITLFEEEEEKEVTVRFYEVIRTINPYEQLLINYCSNYWENRKRKYFTPAAEVNASPPRKNQVAK